MYTSVQEGVATGILEAGACNIPVITTKVGASLYLKNIKTFDTINEAIEIIKYFNENSDKLENYGKALGDEIRADWNWKNVCEKFWKPAFDSILTPKPNDVLIECKDLPNEHYIEQLKNIENN